MQGEQAHVLLLVLQQVQGEQVHLLLLVLQQVQGEQVHLLLLVLQQVQLVHDEVEQQDLEDVEEQQAILIICCFKLVSDN